MLGESALELSDQFHFGYYEHIYIWWSFEVEDAHVQQDPNWHSVRVIMVKMTR